MTIKDAIVAFHISVGVRSYIRLNLSPDPVRKTDEWVVDPTSRQLTINNNLTTAPEDLFWQLLQAKSASIDASYDGAFSDVGIPLDKLTVGNFTIVPSSVAFQVTAPAVGDKQQTFRLESLKGVVGRPTQVGLVPRSGPVLALNPTTCAVVTDDRLVQNATELMTFLLSRLRVNATPYLADGSLVKLELETDA